MIDPEITKAIQEACIQNGQDKSFADKLCKWVEASGAKQMTQSENSEFLGVVLNAIKTGR